MVVCKFFQQGYCRFGNRCWNEHVSGSRFSNTYNQEHETRSGSSGFSFKAALQQSQQPQQLQQSQMQPAITGGQFSFAKAFNAISNPQFGNQVQNQHVSFTSHQFQAQPTFSTPIFGHSSQFGVTSHVSNVTSYSDVDMNVSDQLSVDSQQIQPQLVTRSFMPEKTEDSTSVVYSLLDSLTAEELNQYQSNEFTFGKIPLKPPPREVC